MNSWMNMLNDLLICACKENDVAVQNYDAGRSILEMLGLTEVVENTEGFAFDLGSGPFILYNKRRHKASRLYTVAHELAHAVMGHLDKDCTLSHECREKEANIFASVFVAMSIFCVAMNKEGFNVEVTTV